MFQHLIFLFLLTTCELIYFRIADKYDIIDHPNERSSHSEITLRGGGIIFPISVILWFAFYNLQYPFLVGGLLLITIISFIDDLKDLSSGIRLFFHLTAVSIAFWALHMFDFSLLVIVLSYVMVIGIINAYNFMDGINGITGIYSLVVFCTLLWINQYQVAFVNTELLITIIIGVLVFNFFNFRKQAKCFAGDVGSVSVAFIICFLLLKLILQTNQLMYIMLLAVYGIDTVFTILVRLSRKENILKAHRSHLYQLLANERKLPHRTISVGYGLIQIIVNVLLLYFISKHSMPGTLMTLAVLVFIYWVIRLKVWLLNKQVVAV